MKEVLPPPPPLSVDQDKVKITNIPAIFVLITAWSIGQLVIADVAGLNASLAKHHSAAVRYG